ncbi:ABC transporter ATP-binding protein [Fenollaria timonensis]|uniref:ABC transporter ATP-binding protein n=1 Tax=Fenollaria timonensis TaxID=1723384 RepID=UPI00071DEEA2|nr:ATP-binding cassette domain-containing protein [Fenollaria timonensis]
MKLELIDIKKSFAGKEVLHGINLETSSGSSTAFLGRNGAGKTTTIRILMDVFKADSGKILIDGAPIDRKEIKLGYLPEERGMYAKSAILDQLIYFGRIKGLDKKESHNNAIELLEKVKLSEYKAKNLDTLSKGNQQKIQIIQTFINKPDIIILDEPFSGLDPVNSQILIDLIKEAVASGPLLIFSSHQMSHVENFCDNIALIKDGKNVLTGNLKEIKKNMGEGKLRISFYNDAVNYLQDIFDLAGQDNVSIKDNDIIVRTSDKADELAKFAISKDNFRAIAKYEPSLEEIFIEAVGDKDEE